jgi:hypothetical protein
LSARYSFFSLLNLFLTFRYFALHNSLRSTGPEWHASASLSLVDTNAAHEYAFVEKESSGSQSGCVRQTFSDQAHRSYNRALPENPLANERAGCRIY